MQANSRLIHSAQVDMHTHLAEVVRRHASTVFRKPVADYNRQAFDEAVRAWRQRAPDAPLILDAGCGIGESTLQLAQRFPDHFVIGVDQSAKRLQAGKDWWDGPMPDNYVWARADLVDFWRLMAADGIRPARHMVLYPNPWPKIGHLARRWHGHAVFPTLVALGGVIECRSNWRIYIDEFAEALRLLGVAATVEAWRPEQAITPFERKYAASGHALWRCVGDAASSVNTTSRARS